MYGPIALHEFISFCTVLVGWFTGLQGLPGLGQIRPGTVPEKIRDFVSANMAWMVSQAGPGGLRRPSDVGDGR